MGAPGELGRASTSASGGGGDSSGDGREPPPARPAITEEMRDKIEALKTARGMTEESATAVIVTGKCEECNCVIGEEVAEDACMCSCHCTCCCPPLFKCRKDCSCTCDCHYEPSASASSDEGESDERASAGEEDDDDEDTTATQKTMSALTKADEIVKETQEEDKDTEGQVYEANDTDSDAPTNHGDTAGSSDQAAHGVTVGGRNGEEREPEILDTANEMGANPDGAARRAVTGEEADGDEQAEIASEEANQGPGAGENPEDIDEDMMKAPELPKDLSAKNSGQLFHLLLEQYQASQESAAENRVQLTALLFAKVYKEAIQPGQTKQRANKLPTLSEPERILLQDLIQAAVVTRKYSFQRVLGLMKELALASTKSKWSFTNILQDRLNAASTQRSEPANEWTERAAARESAAREELAEIFRFDPTVYSADETHRLRALCELPHVFATGTREATPEEWRIMVGMMDGSIIAKAMPAFMKRCCNAIQLPWVHDQIRTRVEGEVWARLPPRFEVFDYNQTSKRLVDQIRRDATRLKWTDDRLFKVLGLLKAAAYDKEKHSIHLFFYTKRDAIMADQLQIPYRNLKLTLINPDAVHNQQVLEDDAMLGHSDHADGLTNDRYQAFHRMRITNLTRTIKTMALIAYLMWLTKGGLKTAVPLDAYGPMSEWSLLWDIYSKTPQCPIELVDINRIILNGHHLLVLHNPGLQAPPCHQCARLGHQAADCKIPKDEWNDTHTLIITQDDLKPFLEKEETWTTEKTAFDIFTRMGTQTRRPRQTTRQARKR